MIHEICLRSPGLPKDILGKTRLALLGLALGCLVDLNASAEIVFQDFFTQPATNVTNSLPWIDVEGSGWQSGVAPSQLALDGSGHLYNTAVSAGAAAGVQLVPIGPHGSMTASAIVQLPTGSTEWVGMGFGNSNQFLTAAAGGSGPWIQASGTGAITLYGGAGLNNPVSASNAFTNDGSPAQIFLTYDAFHATASAGTISGGVTNLVFNQWPVTNSAGAIAPRYFVLQMSTNLTSATARWATAATVDWIPRPLPMLTLPVPVRQTNFVGPLSGNDVPLIQNAFNLVSNSATPTEMRFTTGATYIITNDSLVADIPLVLSHATNVVVNGNGCKILVTNPRIGFMSVSLCSNVIVEGFTVDYDPLPYTQGMVTHNFYTSNDVPKELAIEFQVDPGYLAPTNANYIDTNAITIARRWGTVMDPIRLGRGADNSYPGCYYTNVVQTNSNGAFKVYLQFPNQAKSIQPGALWNMISRWNGSTVFNTYLSYQVTWMNNTNYAGAGISYGGQFSPLVCEISDQIQLGLPPPDATAPRLRTSNADGGYFVESRIGPRVQGCNFTALSDDTANPCINGFIITNVPVQPTNTFAVYENVEASTTPTALIPYQAHVGDVVLFFNATNGTVFDRATITAVNLPEVTFDHAISNVVAGTYDTNTLLVDLTLNTSAVYLDNQFSNSRQHGIYCRADNTLIAHNTISGMELSAIGAYPAMTSTFLNLFVPTNVVILDNILSDCGYSQPGISNAIPTQEPAYALVEFHKASAISDYVTNGFEISGIRILYNAFLDWRRAPLSLHNATDVNVIGNYFGPPITSDGLVPLASDIIADLWVSDYPNLRFTNNVNATGLPDSVTINEDGTPASVPVNAFQPAEPPQLAANRSGTNLVVSWVSPAPGFVLQQAGRLVTGTSNWIDITNSPWLAAAPLEIFEIGCQAQLQICLFGELLAERLRVCGNGLGGGGACFRSGRWRVLDFRIHGLNTFLKEWPLSCYAKHPSRHPTL
jgi:hypothetical protein